MSMKTKVFDVIRIVVLLIALSVLLYPTVSNYLYEKNSARATQGYDDTLEKMSKEEADRMLADARAYNERLVASAGAVEDPFSTTAETSPEYEELLRIEDNGMMGYIRIPKIDVELPIYHGTSGAAGGGGTHFHHLSSRGR